MEANYRVKNIGKIASDRYVVELWDDTEEELIDSTTHTDLEVNNLQAGTFDWTPQEPGEHELRFLVKDSYPAEEDLTNNDIEKVVRVNKLPVAHISANKTSNVYTNENIRFDGSESTDDDPGA